MSHRCNCRIWWPQELTSQKPSSSAFLFGWSIPRSPSSIDIIVAFSLDETSFYNRCSDFQEILHKINVNMPAFLQTNSVFIVIGDYSTANLCEISPSDDPEIRPIIDQDHQIKCTSITAEVSTKRDLLTEACKSGRRVCNCINNEFLQNYVYDSGQNHCWIHLVDSHASYGCKVNWIPGFHCIHFNSQMLYDVNVHVIIYKPPRFSADYFTLNLWSTSEWLNLPYKKPERVRNAHEGQKVLELEIVIQALNCVASAKFLFDRELGSLSGTAHIPVPCMFLALLWKLLALLLCIFSTILYISLKLLHCFQSFESGLHISHTISKVFRNTSCIIQRRSCQILYWPIMIKDSHLRSQSCVEYAEKAAVHRHSLWSSIIVDVFLGNVIGFTLLYYAENARLFVLRFSNNMADNVLRSGCVWLMGVPAGFKLNTELAGVLGNVSLNVIQMWSTLWFFLQAILIYFVKALAISGIFFGATVPAAIILDMVLLATTHISTLHYFIGVAYSVQIQSFGSMWRLFRGRKWNPLRQRFDSYDYSVEQHIVGSLFFTPLLLLLPTTSVFYIFFTLLETSISLTCIAIEVAIYIVHITPYSKIFVWLIRPERFPSGIWFEITNFQKDDLISISSFCSSDGPHSKHLMKKGTNDDNKFDPTALIIHSNMLSLRELVLPYYKEAFSGVAGVSIVSFVYGILTGARVAHTIGIVPESKMKWRFMPWRLYWLLCRASLSPSMVLDCC